MTGRALPFDFKAAAVICVLASSAVGVANAMEAMGAAAPRASPEQLVSGPAETHAFQIAVMRAELAAIEPMRGLRVLACGVLSMACGFSVIAGIRLLRPGPIPREIVRRLAAGAMLVGGVSRTVAGAQNAVIATAEAKALTKLLATPGALQDPGLRWGAQVWIEIATPFSVLLTLIFAGMFLGLWTYLRSQRARALVADSAPPTAS